MIATPCEPCPYPPWDERCSAATKTDNQTSAHSLSYDTASERAIKHKKRSPSHATPGWPRMPDESGKRSVYGHHERPALALSDDRGLTELTLFPPVDAMGRPRPPVPNENPCLCMSHAACFRGH